MSLAADVLDLTFDARGVARLCLNRPQRHNAFDEALIAALTEALGRCAADPAVRVVLLTGAGANFCAGADVDWMRRAASASPADNLADAHRFAGLMAALADCPKPTVAAVQGLALGGGVGLVAACDIALAAPDAFFGVTEVRLGILPAVIGPYLIRALGTRNAQALALQAQRIDAPTALRLGLVQGVAEDLGEAVDAVVGDLLRGGPQAQASLKTLFASLPPGDTGATVQALTARTIAQVRQGAEAREGFEAFQARRSPRWSPP